MKKSGATLARFALEQLGVTHTLGIPGVHNSELHDELNASPNIQPVLVTHECGAACMADAYSSAGQRIGTSVIVPAAGVTHAASGIGEASLDGIDQHSLLAPIYKASFRIENHRDVIPALHRAYQIATGREPGQVLIQKRSSCTDRPALGPSGQAGSRAAGELIATAPVSAANCRSPGLPCNNFTQGECFMSAAKKTLTGLAVIGLGFGWLVLAPPELLRVGANYSAKIVCSNVFIAGRDADQVMRDDLQALGKPLMRLMRVRVDPEQQTVRAGLLGFIGNGLAVNRPGTGCAAVADGDLARAASVTSQRPAIPAPAADQQWPQGSAAQSVPALQALVANPELAGPGVRGIAVIHNGQLVAEHYGPGFSASTPLLGWSMTKSVTAALVGMQIGDGNLNIAQAGFWPKDSGGREAIQLSNLMAMADGLEFNEGYGNVSDVTRMLYLEPDMAAYMQARPLAHEPGKVWSYSSGTTVLLSHLWQQAAGTTALELPYSRLFAPLGMSSAIIEADARGTLVGSSYMYATAQDWARYGQFLLQDGVWQGQRLLPEAYVQTISSPSLVSQGEYAQGQLWRWGPQGSTPEGENPDKRFQLPADTYWMRGHDGQSIAVVPSKQLVVARLGLTPKEQNYQSQGLLSAIIQALP